MTLGGISPESRAELYGQSRPAYSPRVLDFVVEHAGPAVGVLVDVGCGTGLSTLPFSRIAVELIGVEPDPSMRAVAEKLLTRHGIKVRAGTAERTGLPDHSVDFIVAASCAEWFAQPLTAAEWRRVLVPGGKVLLMWNNRAADNRLNRAWDRLWQHHMGPRIGPNAEDIDQLIVPRMLGTSFHRFSKLEQHLFDEQRLLRFAFSSGYAPKPSQERRRTKLQEAIRAFHTGHHQDGSVPLAFRTVAYLGELE
ncbi:methyltransferase domain-containing protein [Saccharopolyspora hattusasensis]|uniref:class I SAM-dependent methyltransferase n=1 Tax=Saccharopolyspora hattusasensis TaxID=1128679 RepID=UPI003D975A52